jgi:beta-lactamase superfamily II metal-dependent hydrolase
VLRPLPLQFATIAVSLLGVVLAALLIAGRATPQFQMSVPELKGDGALVITPEGFTILIDGGRDGAAVATWLGEALPFAQRRIDLMILTRSNPDVLPGQLAAIRRYQIGTALVSSSVESASLETWRRMLDDQNTPIHSITTRTHMNAGSCKAQILDEREGRLMVMLRCGATVAYFLQAINDQSETTLETQALPPATVVVYPWSRVTNTRLIRMLQPGAIVFSEGDATKVGLSWQDRKIGAATLLHESIHGRIDITSNEGRMRIAVARGEERHD